LFFAGALSLKNPISRIEIFVQGYHLFMPAGGGQGFLNAAGGVESQSL
jgi:hypothetical protein